MRLTRAAEYAIRCVLYMAHQPVNKVISRKEISQEMDIPDQFLGKIAQQLARAGFIEILQGAKGGFRLLSAPGEITLLNVIEAVMGEIILNDCILRPSDCERANTCAVHKVWQKARRQLRQTLQEANFETLQEMNVCEQPDKD